jgi:hypothetical protein
VENEKLSASEIKHLQKLIDAHGEKAPKKARRGKP